MYKFQASLIEKTLVLAMVCSVWTQLRVASVIGASEILLLIIAFLMQGDSSPAVYGYQEKQVQFIKTVLIITPLGLVWNTITQGNYSSMIHDLCALIFVLIVILRVYPKVKLYQNLNGILYWFFIFGTFANIMYILMYRLGMGMYLEERFEGWSSDPNQLAEYLMLIPWMGIYFLKKINEYKPSNAFICRAFCVLCTVSSVYIAMLTESDSYTVSTLTAVVVYAIFESIIAFNTGKGAGIMALVDVVIIIGLIVYFDDLLLYFNNYYAKLSADANQVNVRTRVWLHGFQAFLNSPIFGNGPGSYSGNWCAFGNVESHNTYIYVMMDFGMIGLFVFLDMFIFTYQVLKLSDHAEIIAAFASFLIFNWFHSFHRMPLFWFYIYLFISVGIAEHNQSQRVYLMQS